MSFEACAGIVQRGDPDRFLAVMSAPVELRRIMFPIYAFNVEVARAPWVTEEPMIAEMRLQWWRDALEEIAQGKPVRKHEVTTALADVLDPEGARSLDGLIAARRWDVYKDSFEDVIHFEEYINATSGDLLWAVMRACVQERDDKTDYLGRDEFELNVKRFGHGIGVANWFRAIPELEVLGRKPLVDGTNGSVRLLATAAQRDIASARAGLGQLKGPAGDVLRVGWRAQATLKTAAKHPMKVAHGALEESPFMRRASLFWKTLRGTY